MKTNEQAKQEAIKSVVHTNSDCREEKGITISLIDSLITIARVLRPRLNQIDNNVYEALKDLHNDEDLLFVLKTGPHNRNIKRTSNKDLIKTLDDLNGNNGWIRIEPDGSNLPTDDSVMYKVFDKTYVSEFSFDMHEVIFDFNRIRATHYKPITPELKPVY